MTIHVEKRPYKNFVSPRMLESYRITSILLLIYYSTSIGKAKYIHFDKLHFLFDLLMCKQDIVGQPKLTLPPWKIDQELKKTLIVLSQSKLIDPSFYGIKVRYSLTNEGYIKATEILDVPELHMVSEKAKSLALSVSTSTFEASKVIF